MIQYLKQLQKKYNLNISDITSVYDELPLWSAPFGMTILDQVVLKPGIKALDIGPGTGFPFLELAMRLGKKSKVYGIDPWEEAIERIRLKLKVYNIKNAEIIYGFAEEMSFPDNFFDLILSNNGLNNVNDLSKVLSECNRIGKKDSQLIFTVNLPGTMYEFYEIMEDILLEKKRHSEIASLHRHISEKRKSIPEITWFLKNAGFKIKKITEDKFYLRYVNGSAMLNHYFIRLAFLENWKKIIVSDVGKIFTEAENRLNKLSEEKNELKLTVPFVCFDCRKK
ncbi:MAG: class I SAM-dependent methyltransferase [Bacteroidia bacterium]|nr:class I SAM-dependent methyltransferase [Bacteroidia bacterium]